MIRLKKTAAVAVTAAALVVGLAGPASALRYTTDPNKLHNGGAAMCSSKKLIETYVIDGPASGYKKVGDAKLFRYWCVTSTTSSGWYAHRTEAHLDSGAAIYVGITQTVCNPNCYPYSLGAWGSGTDWNASPVLERGDYTTPFVKNGSGQYLALIST